MRITIALALTAGILWLGQQMLHGSNLAAVILALCIAVYAIYESPRVTDDLLDGFQRVGPAIVVVVGVIAFFAIKALLTSLIQ